MGAAYGKKKAYSIHHQPPPKQQANGRPPNRSSASADRQQQPVGRGPGGRGPGGGRGPAPLAVPVPAPDYEDADQDLIRPKKLLNPVKASRSHQELHRELLSSCKRDALETKPELQRVLEARRRDQLIRQRKQEEEARKKVCPLEAELLKRQRKLEELEQMEQMEEQQPGAPEFIRVREKLRRTSLLCKEEEEL